MACTPACVFPTPSQAHCSACHNTFSGIRLFDSHRHGVVQDRVCWPPDGIPKMPTRKDARGVWRANVPNTRFRTRHSATDGPGTADPHTGMG